MASQPARTEVGAERATMTPSDWEQAALELIADKGLSGLAVEPLARRLGITKGSFYWHFPNRDELLEAALQRWESQDQANLQRALSVDQQPAERLATFVWATTRQTLTHRIYAALCAAPEDRRVQPVLERVSRRRMTYLANAFAELGLDATTADQRARLVYTAYLGYLHLQAQSLVPEAGDVDFEAYVEHVIDSLIRPVD